MKLLITAEHFGYGPITTALNVVKELKKYNDINISFMGTGIALEQAKMTNYFDKIIECKTYDINELKKVKNILLDYDVILSSENQPGVKFAIECGHKSVYFIDNLMWMWDKLDEGLEQAKGYFISEIIPSKKNFDRIGKNIKNPHFIGPLRELKTKKILSKEKKLIINIGGAEAFVIDSNIVKKYYNKLINEILDIKLIYSSFDKIIICGGSGVINSLKINNANDKTVVKTLSNEEYLNELDSCSHCIFASGLGNFIESVWRDKDILYIPPINYSQLLQLDYYEKMDFGFKIINWDEFDFFQKIPTLLDENTGVDLVIDNVKKYLNDKSDIVKNVVQEFLQNSQMKFYDKRKKYISKFNGNGAKEIAQIIYKEN